MSRKNLDTHFKNTLFDHSVEPPKAVWESINAELNTTKSAGGNGGTMQFLLLMLLLLTSAGIFSFVMLDSGDQKNQPSPQQLATALKSMATSSSPSAESETTIVPQFSNEVKE